MPAPKVEPLVLPAEVQPGETFEVHVQATSDPLTARLVAHVRNLEGHDVPVEGSVQVADVLTYELIDVTGAGFTITPDPERPGVFSVQAPG